MVTLYELQDELRKQREEEASAWLKELEGEFDVIAEHLLSLGLGYDDGWDLFITQYGTIEFCHPAKLPKSVTLKTRLVRDGASPHILSEVVVLRPACDSFGRMIGDHQKPIEGPLDLLKELLRRNGVTYVE